MAPVDPAFECTVAVTPSVGGPRRSTTRAADRSSRTVRPSRCLVWAFYVTDADDDTEGHAQRRTTTGTCYPPAAEGVAVGDRIELPGKGRFKVTAIGDYDDNPVWQPGLADVKLRKVDG
ncbi:hypothetical protein GS928_25840 [Rhodococcus hoagii]|nr:hypothetical protein [Prescottella equi]